MVRQQVIKLTKEQEEAFANAFPSITIEQQMQMTKGAFPISDVSESSRLQKCKDDAAIREGYRDWNDMLI